jgi:uncharacterized protein YceK
MRAVLLIFATLVLASCNAQSKEQSKEPSAQPALTHAVFFELKNKDEASVRALVEGAYKYLEPHDGIVYFSIGPRHAEYRRDVNDLTFDVALTIVFDSTAAQEAYQVTEAHKQFIAELEDNWASVRVFDSRTQEP